MTVGRLNRESNPVPGEKPGFTPQYKNANGSFTDITPSTPLPSGNYVMKNGVWVPWDGSTQLTGRTVKLERSTFDQTLNLAPSSFVNISVRPPIGEFWRIKNLQLQIAGPPNATTGNHFFHLMTGGTDSSRESVLTANYNFDKEVRIRYNKVVNEILAAQPASELAQQNAILNLVATNSAPITINYVNSTDVTQTNTLKILVTREVEYIAT